MSLQKMLQERSLEKQQVSQIAVQPALPTTYVRRCVKYARSETREHKKVELFAAFIVAVISGLLFGGFSLGGVAYAIIALLATIVVIFLIHLIRAPMALDTALRRELSNKQLLLEGLKRHQLELEVDTRFESNLFFIYDSNTVALPGTEPFKNSHYVIKAYLRIRFVNHVMEKFAVDKISVSLSRVTKHGHGKRKEIPLRSRPHIELSKEGEIGKINLDSGLLISDIGKTDYYKLHADLEVQTKYGERLDENCFLRFTMEAIGQLTPYHVELNVDWDTARKKDYAVYLTPRK